MKTIGKIIFLLIAMMPLCIINTFGQTQSGVPGKYCDSAGSFCADQTQYSFQAGVNSGDFGNHVACLNSTKNPAWYIMQVGESGRINISMSTTPFEDIDFACWGPFSSKTEGCGLLKTNCPDCHSHESSFGANPTNLGGYPNGNIVDCSFSPDVIEYVHIPNAISGQWYLLLVTNYSNTPCKITIGNDPSSSGTSNCAILSSPISDTVCVGDTATFKVAKPINGARYTWQGPGFYLTTYDTVAKVPTFPYYALNYSNDPPDTTYFNSGSYPFTLTISVSENQPPSEALPFNFVVNPKPTISINSDSICVGESATLTTTGNYSFLWNTQQTTPSITVSPATTTQYAVTATTNWGCKDSLKTHIVVFNNPDITITPNTVCSGELATAFASNATSFVWDNGHLTTDTIRPIVTSQKTYTVTATTNEGCSGTATLTANPNPTIDISSQEICQGEVATVRASGATTYNWSNGNSGAEIEVSPSNNMDISVIGTNEHGCKGSDTTTIVVHTKPTAGFITNSDLVTIDESNVTFTDLSANATSWLYNFGELRNPLNTSTDQNPTHSYISVGIFRIWQVVTTDFGCADSTSRQVQVEAPYFFYVPSAFTPDNDGKNEEFCPKGKGVDKDNYSMEIFDRWGILLFKTDVPFACWDGKINGENVPMGNYIYKINVKDMEAKYHEYMGTITILK